MSFVFINRSTLPLLALTVELLASQTLDDLRSKLHCENDFVYICPIKHPKDVKKMDWKKFAGVHDVSGHTFVICEMMLN